MAILYYSYWQLSTGCCHAARPAHTARFVHVLVHTDWKHTTAVATVVATVVAAAAAGSDDDKLLVSTVSTVLQSTIA